MFELQKEDFFWSGSEGGFGGARERERQRGKETKRKEEERRGEEKNECQSHHRDGGGGRRKAMDVHHVPHSFSEADSEGTRGDQP